MAGFVTANANSGEVADLAAPANVSIAQTSSLGQNGNPGTGPFTASCTLSGTPTAGNILVVAVGTGNGTTSFSVSSWAGSPGWAFTFSDAGLPMVWEPVTSNAAVPSKVNFLLFMRGTATFNPFRERSWDFKVKS